jgi:hypothetical protein
MASRGMLSSPRVLGSLVGTTTRRFQSTVTPVALFNRRVPQFNGGRLMTVRWMHNPMFPQRAIPEVDEAATGSKTKAAKDDDFLSNHGGKVFAACAAAIFALLYSYIKGNSERNNLDDALSDERAVEPLETNEVRLRNKNFTSAVFDDIARTCYSQLQGDLSCTYPEFSVLVSRVLRERHGVSLAQGHVLDRIILTKCMKLTADETEAVKSQEPKPFSKLDEDTLSTLHPTAVKFFSTYKFPLSYLLVALNGAVCERAESRIESLFTLALLQDNDNSDSDSTACSRATAEDIVTQLCETWQVHEKRDP